MTQIRFDPLLPWWAIAALAVLAVLVAGFTLWWGLRGWPWRGLAGLAAAAALAGPALEIGSRAGLSDIVILIDDRSASQGLPERTAQTDAAIEELTRRIAALPDTELRRVTVGDSAGDEQDGTLLATAMARAVAAEPESRLAGVIAVTDGRLHDPAMLPAAVPTPIHVLLTGRPQDWDRRLVIEEAPAFGLIGQPVSIRLRIEDQGEVPPEAGTGPVPLAISLDGGEVQVFPVPIGVPLDLPVTPAHAGQNVVQIGFDAPVGDELTDRNNSAAISINGVRDRLRVLLISGQPHAGERTWRNLLKSDAAVDLIHFTILRPPDKFDGVAVDELSLIAFPTQELFMERIDDFDLIIFDRDRVRGILPPEYYQNIVRYVREGGAILVSAGPEMAGVESLNLSPLGRILPARPTGRILNQPFTPLLTDDGRRHPVTAGLPGAPDEDGENGWGRWLRQVEAMPDLDAQVAMTGAGSAPLLILSREGEGRVALLTSDQVWLWGRGFEGGGPQLELLRRIAHWSMKEPELEEEALLADVSVHVGKPLFPGDVDAALRDADGPRLLVTTPVHLRALVESGVALPPLAGIVTATAPLSPALARDAESRFSCEVREMFGSTETCVIARRRTARDGMWTPLPGVRVVAQPDGARVEAPHLPAPVALADLVEVHGDGRFVLRGRQADLLEIAGKRASLGELTQRLLAVPGVRDGVLFQLDEADAAGIRRIAALVVADGLDETAIVDALRTSIDPAFLPRRVRLVDALPRNDTGKLPRDALLRVLHGGVQ